MRAAGSPNPKAMRVMSRILVFADSSPLPALGPGVVPGVPTDLFQRAGGLLDHVERVIRSPRVLIQVRKL
jgi:hypothetical protein